MGKVRAKTQPGWRHTNGALEGQPVLGTGCGQPVSHTPGLTPLEPSGSVYQGREGRKKNKKDAVRLGGSHAHLTSHPAVTLVCFRVYLKKIKGMIAQE